MPKDKPDRPLIETTEIMGGIIVYDKCGDIGILRIFGKDVFMKCGDARWLLGITWR